MKSKYSIQGWLAVAFGAAVFFGGCATHPMASTNEPPRLHHYPLEGDDHLGDDLLPDSYAWTNTSVGGDGLWYWTEVYYLHYPKKPEGEKPPFNPPYWDSRPGHARHVKAVATDPGTDDAGTDYGWYVQITHPGGDYTVVGVETNITHPGGSPASSTAK